MATAPLGRAACRCPFDEPLPLDCGRPGKQRCLRFISGDPVTGKPEPNSWGNEISVGFPTDVVRFYEDLRVYRLPRPENRAELGLRQPLENRRQPGGRRRLTNGQAARSAPTESTAASR